MLMLRTPLAWTLPLISLQPAAHETIWLGEGTGQETRSLRASPSRESHPDRSKGISLPLSQAGLAVSFPSSSASRPREERNESDDLTAVGKTAGGPVTRPPSNEVIANTCQSPSPQSIRAEQIGRMQASGNALQPGSRKNFQPPRASDKTSVTFSQCRATRVRTG